MRCCEQDYDLYVSIYQTLERLYPLLQPGGFVVFDDFKFSQAQEAIFGYRKSDGTASYLPPGPASATIWVGPPAPPTSRLPLAG